MFCEANLSFFKNMFPVFLARFMTQYVHINPHLITKHEGCPTFHYDLCLDVFTTDRTMEIFRKKSSPRYI